MKLATSAAALTAALLVQIPVRSHADSAVVDWDKTALQAIRDTHPGPPIVARALAIVHTCAYDAWAAYDPIAVGTQLGGTLRRPAAERTDANKNKAASFAAFRALVDLFPQPDQVTNFRNAMIAKGYDPNDVSTNTSTPSGIGNVAAAAVITFRHTDGSNQLGDLNPGPYSDYTGYVPVNTPDLVNDPNHWQPLRIGVNVQKFITPQWGKVEPFALTNPAQFRPTEKPAAFGTQEYVEQAREVLSYSASLTDEQKTIAEYWADGPSSELPPGHWALFAQFVSHRDNLKIDDDAKMFFAMTNAIFDASVSSWEAKRFFDYVRPVTAIHVLFAGQQVPAWAGPGLGTQLIDGATWRPYQAATVVTPPFPEYISGHSIFSASGAEILKLYTGSDVFGGSVSFAVGSSRVEPGLVPHAPLTLSWATFSDAADEAGISRRYGGIHFREGDLISRQIGRLVGDQAWAKAVTYFNPQARGRASAVPRVVSSFHRKEQNLFEQLESLNEFLLKLPTATGHDWADRD